MLVCKAASEYSELAVPWRMPIRYYPGMGYSEVILAARTAKKWTQQELADQVGVAQPTVQRWEAGKRAPEAEVVPLLAEVLGVERHTLVDFDYERLGLTPTPEIQATAEVHKLVKGYNPDQ